MAIYHFEHSFIRRGGTSSLAHAAYNAGQKLEDKAGLSEHSDYSRKGGVLHDEIALPFGTPKWADNRGELWRRLEAREDKSTRPGQAILAHSFIISLPCELTLEQNIWLAKDFVREQFVRKGYAVDWAVHAPDLDNDERNIHLHILVPLRQIVYDSFGNKDRYPKPVLRQKLRSWRTAWATLANRHLKRHGYAVTIDERSLKEQGITDRLPTRPRRPRSSRKSKRAVANGIRMKWGKQPVTRAFPQPTRPLLPAPQSTPAAPAPGGGGTSITLKERLRRAARAEAVNKPASTPAFMPNINTRGWPEAAIRDWKDWGHKNPVRFFALWSELSGNGPGAGL